VFSLAPMLALTGRNDDYGRDLFLGLKRGIQRSRVGIAAAETYEVTASDGQSQILKLKASWATRLRSSRRRSSRSSRTSTRTGSGGGPS
jgi:hypothetical protein